MTMIDTTVAPNLAANTTVPIPFNNHLDNLFGVFCLFSFLFGTAGNVMALFYFSRKKKDVPTIIYTSVVVVDMVLSILVFPVGVSLFDDRNKIFFDDQIFCDMWGFVWIALSRMSVFLVGLLSVSRAYSLTFPFRTVKKRVIGAIILAACVIHILGASIPLWYNDNHLYHKAVASCAFFSSYNMPERAVTATKAFDYLGLLIPVPVIVASFILTVLQLSKKTMAGGGRGDGCKQNITVTIALFTGTYLFFNVPAAVVMLLYNFTGSIAWPDQVYLVNYIFIMVIPLNAACNPIIYLWRMERMRAESLNALRRSIGSTKNAYAGPHDPVTIQSYVVATRVSNDNLNGVSSSSL